MTPAGAAHNEPRVAVPWWRPPFRVQRKRGGSRISGRGADGGYAQQAERSVRVSRLVSWQLCRLIFCVFFRLTQKLPPGQHHSSKPANSSRPVRSSSSSICAPLMPAERLCWCASALHHAAHALPRAPTVLYGRGPLPDRGAHRDAGRRPDRRRFPYRAGRSISAAVNSVQAGAAEDLRGAESEREQQSAGSAV